MIERRSFITTAAAISASLMLAAAPALAQGGNDPIEGIDIIVKKDPSSQPIKPFSLDEGQIKTLNRLKDADRRTFVLKSIAGRIEAGESFVPSGMTALGEIWCGPCKMADEISVTFRDGEVTYTLDLTFRQ